MAGKLAVLQATLVILLAHAAFGLQLDLSRLSEKVIDLPYKASENVLGVPIVDPPTRSAGYFKLDKATKAGEMFYFYFQARQNPTQAPVVLWMTGGPGCSSELAVLYEQGPYYLDKAGTSLTEREFGWDVTHNMIFVDQPLGTGFSFTNDDHDTVYDEKGVADDMLDFLWHFYAAHPDLASLPLYITGESYAGHYVPAVSHRVWLSNKNKEGPYINLRGLAVGNGLTEPSIQFNAYGDFALQNNLISEGTRGWMSFWYPLCRLANKWCDSTNWDFVCGLGLQICMITQFQPILAANPDINVYDYTRKCEGRLCYDFTAADKFLNLPSTKAALGVSPSKKWVSCDPYVYEDMAGDWLHRYDSVLPDMMQDGIRVMIYAGDLDLICNYLGNRRWVDALDWYGTEGWDDAQDFEWLVQGKAAGKAKHWGPLSFVQVYKAGHMVPMDQPLNSLAMITAWTRNKSVSEVMGTHPRPLPAAAAAAAKHVGHKAVQQQQQGPESLPSLFARLTADDAAEAGVKKAAGEEVAGGVEEVLRGAVRKAGLSATKFVSKVTSTASKVMAAAQAAADRVSATARKLMMPA